MLLSVYKIFKSIYKWIESHFRYHKKELFRILRFSLVSTLSHPGSKGEKIQIQFYGYCYG